MFSVEPLQSTVVLDGPIGAFKDIHGYFVMIPAD